MLQHAAAYNGAYCGGQMQTVDVGGVEAQVVGQWGTGYIIAVPADQPVLNSAWVTPVGMASVDACHAAAASTASVDAVLPGQGMYYPQSFSMPQQQQLDMCQQQQQQQQLLPQQQQQVLVAPAASAAPAPTPVVAKRLPLAPALTLTERLQPPPERSPPDGGWKSNSQRQAAPELPNGPKVFVHNSDGTMRPMPKNSASAQVEKQAKAKVFVHHSDGGLQSIPQMGTNFLGGEKEAPTSRPPASLPAAGQPGGSKIFVHDSDGVLHHVAKCSQSKTGFDVDVLDQYNHQEEEWDEDRFEDNLPAYSPPWQAQQQGHHGGAGHLSNIDRGGAWCADNRSAHSSEDSTRDAESLPSPCQSSGESWGQMPTPGPSRSSSVTGPQTHSTLPDNNQSRVRELVACGPPIGRAPPPPPPPPRSQWEAVRGHATNVSEQQAISSSKTARSGRRTGRARGGKAGPVFDKAELDVDAVAAAAAPSIMPELPVFPVLVSSGEELEQFCAPAASKKTRYTSSQLASAVLAQVYRVVAVPVELRSHAGDLPPQRARKGKEFKEPPSRSAPSTMKKRSGHEVTHQKSDKRSIAAEKARNKAAPEPKIRRKVGRGIWRQFKQKVSSVRCFVRSYAKEISPRTQQLILVASVIFLLFSISFYCAVSGSLVKSNILTRPAKASVHAWTASSPLVARRAPGALRVGPLQQKLDIEAARALASAEQAKQTRLDRTAYSELLRDSQSRGSSRGSRASAESSRRQSDQYARASSYSQHASASARGYASMSSSEKARYEAAAKAYYAALAQEWEELGGAEGLDGDLSALLAHYGDPKGSSQSSEQWAKMAAAYKKLSSKYVSSKKGDSKHSDAMYSDTRYPADGGRYGDSRYADYAGYASSRYGNSRSAHSKHSDSRHAADYEDAYESDASMAEKLAYLMHIQSESRRTGRREA